MNNKKQYDLKLIKQKLNNAIVLIEEIQNLTDEWEELNTKYLFDAMDELENQYWEIDELENQYYEIDDLQNQD